MHHKSKASSHFHIILIDDLQGAKTKLQAKKIIAKHHKKTYENKRMSLNQEYYVSRPN